MPNWCSNDITISHPEPAKLEALAESVQRGKFFNHVVPVPDDLFVNDSVFYGTEAEKVYLEMKKKSNIKKYGCESWYDYCSFRWGTKWDVTSHEGKETKVEDGLLEFGFSSAWCPPTGIYRAMMKQGFSVCAFYHYEFYKCGKWDNGRVTNYDISGWSAEKVREKIPELNNRLNISHLIEELEKEAQMDEDS